MKNNKTKFLLLGFSLWALPLMLWAQDLNVSGTLHDSKSEPVIGATVMVKGTTVGTTTGINGDYDISAPADATLVFSFVGMKTHEEVVQGRARIDVTMGDGDQAIEDVVVTAYGTQKRVSVVGSIASIEPGKLDIGTTKSVTNNLAGQLAGVIAIRRSGEPNYDNSEFWIRGISSFGGGSKAPLVLVDGIERTLSDYDVAEIESFSILKDASASAMYGVRGANGVILVNTKRGKVAPPSVDFRFEQSIQSPTKLPEFAGAVEHMNLINKLAVADGRSPVFPAEKIIRTAAGTDPELYPDVNWIDAITNEHAFSQHANLHVSGGTPMLRYSLVGAYFNEDGIMAEDSRNPYSTGTNLNRYNLRTNVDLNITKTTLLRASVGGYLQYFRKQAYSTDDAFGSAFEIVPFNYPAIYSDGRIPKTNQRVNPWANVTQRGYERATSSKIESLFALEQELNFITEGLRAKATFSFDRWNPGSVTRSKEPTFYLPSTARDETGALIPGEVIGTGGSEFLGHSTGGEYGNDRVYFEAVASYDRTFADKHYVNAMFLYNQESYDDGATQPYRNQGIAGRLSYTYDNRYIGEVNFGYNGSENFAKENRFGFFPSVAVGWLVSEEKFMQPVKDALSKLKFRASWGKAGNDDIGGRRFAYMTTINADASRYYFNYPGSLNERVGVQEGEIGVNNLTWETVTKQNLGVEIGLFGALDFQADVFKERREDIFMQRSIVPAQAGFITVPWANFGVVDNAGFELQATFNKKITDDWFVSFLATYTYANNEIVEIDEAEATKQRAWRSETGRPISTHWGYVAERLFTADDFNADGTLKDGIPKPNISSVPVQPGDIKYVDQDGNGIVDALDEGRVGGTETPTTVYGFGGTVKWKWFDFGFFFQGAADFYRIVINGADYWMPGSGMGALGNIYSNYTDAWTLENPSQDVFYPRLTYGKNINNTVSSTWWKKDMSFLRLRDVEVGYTLPKSVTDKMKLDGIRFYVKGSNLLCFSEFDLWDPELGSNTGFRYPQMKAVIVGMNIKF
jgi:TonB-linked SusC/RagA family outer membrane protein